MQTLIMIRQQSNVVHCTFRKRSVKMKLQGCTFTLPRTKYKAITAYFCIKYKAKDFFITLPLSSPRH